MQRRSIAYRTRGLLLVTLVWSSPGCGDDTTRPPSALRVDILPEVLDLRVGDVAQIQVSVSGTADSAVDLYSSPSSVASIDPGGLVTGLSAGTATITAELRADPRVHASARVRVSLGPPPDSVNVSISPAAILLPANDSAHLVARVAGIQSQAVRWRSADPAVATVSQDGVITGVRSGVVVVLATSEVIPQAFGAATVTVLSPRPVTVSVAPAAVTLQAGTSVQLSGAVAGSTDQRLAWTSLDPSVATVDQSGRVTATGLGNTAVRATSVAYPTASATTAVSVGQVGIVVEPPEATLDPGDTLRLRARTVGVSDTSVTWSTGRQSVATVNINTGLVTALAPGGAIITATSRGAPEAKASAVITVTEPPPSGLSLASIQQVNPATGERTSASPTRLSGILEVTANTGAPADFSGSLSLVLDGSIVATRPIEAGAVPDTAAFILNTAAFDSVTGQPSFENGARILGFWLADSADRVQAVASVPVGFDNPDGFALFPRTVGSSALNPATGEIWTRGDVSVYSLPVIYSASLTVTRVQVGLCAAGNGAPLTSQVDATREDGFNVLFLASVPATVDGTGGAGGIEASVRSCVVSSRTATGLAGPGMVLNGHPELWPAAPPVGVNLDNLAPRITAPFTLGVGQTSVWLTPSFQFTLEAVGLGGVGAISESGVAGVTCTFLAGPDFSSLTQVSTAADLPLSQTAGAYVARVTCTDALGNVATRNLTDGQGNSQTFGVQAP